MRARRLFVYFSLAALSLSILDNASAQVSSRPMLTGTAAMEMVQGCIAKADAEGWRMHIAILVEGTRGEHWDPRRREASSTT